MTPPVDAVLFIGSAVAKRPMEKVVKATLPFYQNTLPQEAGAGIIRRMLAYTDTLMCVENRFEARAEGPLHSHPHTQITYVVSGRFTFTIDGERREVGPGDSMLKTDAVVHGCTCLEEGILLDIFNPMREDFLPEAE